MIRSEQDIQDAISDYYIGALAVAQKKAEYLYDIATMQINDPNSISRNVNFSNEDSEKLLYLVESIPTGLEKEQYVTECVNLIKNELKEKMKAGDFTNIRLPKRKKITLGMMLESTRVKRKEVNGAIRDGIKKVDWHDVIVLLVFSYGFVGIQSAFIGNLVDCCLVEHQPLKSALIGYFSGAILASTGNFPYIINFFKTAISSYKDAEKASLIDKYRGALANLRWRDKDFFENVLKGLDMTLANGGELSTQLKKRR